MAKHLFLSPHFDDAVGSCGGTICRLVAAGHHVLVLTAFGGVESQRLSRPAQVLHREWKLQRPVRRRILEDASACQVLGCAHAFLKIPDAIYRQDAMGRHLYPTFKSLRGSIAPDDNGLAERLTGELHSYLRDKDIVVYCPLSIGAHVDHVIVRNCGRLLLSKDFAVVFYRDFYYDRRWKLTADDFALTPSEITLTRAELDRKLAAFVKYRSQIPSLFRTKSAMRSYFEKTGKNEAFFAPPQARHQSLRLPS